MSEERLFHCIDDAWESGEITDEIRDEAKALLKERLVEAEAWRAVREAQRNHDATVTYMAVNTQIARLDQLKAESTTKGE